MRKNKNDWKNTLPLIYDQLHFMTNHGYYAVYNVRNIDHYSGIKSGVESIRYAMKRWGYYSRMNVRIDYDSNSIHIYLRRPSSNHEKPAFVFNNIVYTKKNDQLLKMLLNSVYGISLTDAKNVDMSNDISDND